MTCQNVCTCVSAATLILVPFLKKCGLSTGKYGKQDHFFYFMFFSAYPGETCHCMLFLFSGAR